MEQALSPLVVALGRAAASRQQLAANPEAAAILGMLRDEYAGTEISTDRPTEETRPEALDHLAAVFDLSQLDVDLLVAASAGDLDVRITALYGLLLGSNQPRPPTIGLLLELCGYGSLSAAARHRLSPSGPLRRHRLIFVEGREPLLWRSVRVPERVTGHLLGDATVVDEVAGLLIDVAGLVTPEAERLGRAMTAGAHVCHVRSGPADAGLALARGAFATLGVASMVVDLSRAPSSADPAGLVALATREAGLARTGLIITGVDALISRERAILPAIEHSPMPVVVVDQLNWEADWLSVPSMTVTAGPLSRDLRESLWREAVSDEAAQEAGADWMDLVSLRLAPQEVVSAVRAATIGAAADGQQEPSVSALREAARAFGSHGLQSAALRVQPKATLRDLVLPPETRVPLDELVSWARHREALLAGGSLSGKGNKGRGLTALFAGSPGTGKTLAAEAVAGELGIDLYVVDIATVIDKYIGETEKKLERVIHEAESLNVVLLFDEADALFGSRAEVRDARDRYANQGVSYLLQRIERFEGIAILTTNLRGNIDAAFSRRLHHVITFMDPDAPTRRLLWSGHLAEVPAIDPADEPDLDWLAERVEVTGGTIRNVVLAAAFGAASNDEAVGMRHLSAAVRREYQKLGRRLEESALARPSQRIPVPPTTASSMRPLERNNPGPATPPAVSTPSGPAGRPRISARPLSRRD